MVSTFCFRFVLAVTQKTSNACWIWPERPFVSMICDLVPSIWWFTSKMIQTPLSTTDTLPSSSAPLVFLQQFTASRTQRRLVTRRRETLGHVPLLTFLWLLRTCVKRWWPAYSQMSRFQSTAPQTKFASLLAFDFSLRALRHNVQFYTLLPLVCRDRRNGEEAWSDQDACKQWRGERGHYSPGAGHFWRRRHLRWWQTTYPLS